MASLHALTKAFPGHGFDDEGLVLSDEFGLFPSSPASSSGCKFYS